MEGYGNGSAASPGEPSKGSGEKEQMIEERRGKNRKMLEAKTKRHGDGRNGRQWQEGVQDRGESGARKEQSRRGGERGIR